MIADFTMRAPWYVRERDNLMVAEAEAKRPVLQMYDGTDFSKRITGDPAVSMKFGKDDLWSYPVAVLPGPAAKGRKRFATSALVYSNLRKLYQPSHSRFYAVVVEVFCDAAGLPRAGNHDEIQLSFVMRRQHTTLASAPKGAVRKLARALLGELAKEQALKTADPPDLDVDDVWWARVAERAEFEQEHADLLAKVDGLTSTEQAWVQDDTGNRWQSVGDPGAVLPGEEQLPMWRIPPRDGDCEAAATRSLWFGLVPTYASEHWTDEDGALHSKLDDREIYKLRCVVTVPPASGHDQCPPRVYVSEATKQFRLAAATDPDGTKNRTVSITAPDLRRLAARAGQRQGPGGLRITMPPKSRFGPIDFASLPGGSGSMIGGLPICTFAFELFFMVGFFLFFLFLPIVIIVFQLWFLLALRFCIPPTGSFGAVAEFFAAANVDLTAMVGAPQDKRDAFDDVIGIKNAAPTLLARPDFATSPALVKDLVAAMDPTDAAQAPPEPELLERPPDPLCPATPP